MSYIKGTISKIIYRNNSNGYTVGLIKIKESDEEVGKIETFTGVLPEFNEKTIYQLNGTFTTHNKYGYQFQVDSFEIVLPEKKDELVDFLSSDLFPIGEKTAKKIVGSFGEDTIDVILNNSDVIRQINISIHSLANDFDYFKSKAKEYMMLGLRKISGVSISKFERKFRINPLFYFRFEIEKLVNENLIEVDLDNIKLTKRGLDLANLVFEEFI